MTANKLEPPYRDGSGVDTVMDEYMKSSVLLDAIDILKQAGDLTDSERLELERYGVDVDGLIETFAT